MSDHPPENDDDPPPNDDDPPPNDDDPPPNDDDPDSPRPDDSPRLDGTDSDEIPPYRDRIAVIPGENPIAYRPGVVMVEGNGARDRLDELTGGAGAEPVFDDLDDDEAWLGNWFRANGISDAPAVVERLTREGFTSQLDIVYFATSACCGCCPPHPADVAELAANPFRANPFRANPFRANPFRANPFRANPFRANPFRANPFRANAEALNVAATGKAPMSSAMPAAIPPFPLHPGLDGDGIVIGVLDSGLAGEFEGDQMRPEALGWDPASLARISGELDLPSAPIDGTTDRYLDPVAGHGTFIAGIIEQLTPGCTIRVRKDVCPQGDVAVSTLARSLRKLVKNHSPDIVNFSFSGAGTTDDGVFENAIAGYSYQRGIVFVGSAGNEGTCFEQYPAALPEVIGVAALGPEGPAPWTNYGSWVDACAPGTDLVSCFFANFNGEMPPINGFDPDNFGGWATWSGTSFAAPVVVAALAREMATTGCTANAAVERVVRAPHLARLPYMGTIVNY